MLFLAFRVWAGAPCAHIRVSTPSLCSKWTSDAIFISCVFKEVCLPRYALQNTTCCQSLVPGKASLWAPPCCSVCSVSRIICFIRRTGTAVPCTEGWLGFSLTCPNNSMKWPCYHPGADRLCETQGRTDRCKSELGLRPKRLRTTPAFFSSTVSSSLYRMLGLSVRQVTSFIKFELKTDPPLGRTMGADFSSATLRTFAG